MQTSENELTLKLFVVFSCIFILVAIVFLFLFYRFTQTKNDILKEKFKEKLENEVLINRAELLALRSQMNPHFVFNALNTVLYFIQQNDIEQSEDFLAKFSQLVRNFFEYARKTDLTISEELEFISHYLEIEKLRFEDKLSYSIEVDPLIETETTRIPSMILQPIVENAVNHGIFHKKDPGEIGISFKKNNNNSYFVIIRDNGIGINQSKKLYKNTHRHLNTHTHILEERLRLLRDGRQWKIAYSIEDLTSNGGEGTEVTLKIETL
ncbi:sensor histidine kinase YesM [Chryseobacterium defluvii]|uniref:Sensor histidine kinase YesM n=1 Tax=Chryseobacterium defluvii TaxID=160396 RepID=A0A840KI73_9FLAO|nr:histidine kinase [Chryseobacterium defluvii]MBB4807384.1 sensor histidine kinase YesM [Chryseobacterium defluvii]